MATVATVFLIGRDAALDLPWTQAWAIMRGAMAQAKESSPGTEELLREIVDRILAAGNPLKIVLFGSRARGDAGAESDLDLLIVEESAEPRYKRSSKYYRATHGPFPDRDIVVWTPAEIEQWRAVPNHFVTAALREGRVLHERPR